MKKAIYPMLALVIMLGSAFTFIKSQDWKISDAYTVTFTSGDPSGTFRGLQGTISFDEKNPAASKFDVTIDATTVNTGNGMKNTHAKSDKWLDVQKYPVIHFVSSEVSATASGYQAKGTLEMHGVKKDVVMPFTFVNNTFTSSFDINRLDYNINTAEPAHGASTLKVDISVPVTKQ